jgi:hypothetical protein
VSQNLVIANKDNLVVYVFGGIDLTLATDISVVFGAETYTLQLDPTIVIVTSATELSLNLSATLEVGRVFSTVTYFDGGSTLGEDITSQELGNSDQIIVAIGTQLIIEDGSIVANANSLSTDDEFKTYANLRGFSVPSTEPARDALQILAMDYMFSVESRLQGERTNKTDAQELPMPRVGMYARNRYIASNEIPKDFKKAQMELALQAAQSDLLINDSISNLASFEVVGAYKEEYFSGGAWASVRTDRADAYLDPYFEAGGAIRLVRL